MARTRRIKKDGDGHYHVMSRTNNRAFLFTGGKLKTDMVNILKRTAIFSGITLEAYCIMNNHFHIVCSVVKPDEPISEEEVLKRIAVLKGKRFADSFADHLAELKRYGGMERVEVALNAWRRRMHDVSEFTKTFKELVNIRYKSEIKHYGSIWSGRFTSTLVEGGKYLATCIRYVELNPVRAGIVRRSRDYEWSSQSGDTPRGRCDFIGEDEGWLLKRVVQIGEGKIFGGYEFVRREAGGMGDKFSGRATAKPVVGEAYATHGNLLAKKVA